MMVTEDQIDAGAEVLRNIQQGKRITTPWRNLSKSAKQKWREYAAAVLNAAATVR